MKVICTLPNCSESLMGLGDEPVAFVSHAEGMISEEISEEEAAHFLAVRGFHPAKTVDPAAETAVLIERAKAVNLSVHHNWKLNRLREEVEKAEAADKASKGG